MDLRAIEALAAQLDAELEPAGPRAVQAAYQRLSSSYASSKMDEEAEIERATAWTETLRGWPMFALRAAVHAWLKRDTPYMPTPGQLYNIGRPFIEAKQRDRMHCRQILEASEAPETEPPEEHQVDPQMAWMLRRLGQALANKEDIAELRRTGVLW